MGKEVVWGPVIFAGFISTRLFGIAEEIVVLCLMLFLVLLGYGEGLVYAYNGEHGHTLIPSQMVMSWKVLEEIEPS